jgi:hypothetical protein
MTANIKSIGVKYQSIRWKDTFGFSILWNLKILWWVFDAQKILLRFILPSIIKDELEEYCSVSDRTQSQVLRESVNEYLRYVREGFFDKQVG